MQTRGSQKVCLIDNLSPTIGCDKLPTNGDVLSHYFYAKRELKEIKRDKIMCCGWSHGKKLICGESCVCVVKKVAEIHRKAGISTVRPDNMKAVLQKLVDRHKRLINLQKRDTKQEK